MSLRLSGSPRGDRTCEIQREKSTRRETRGVICSQTHTIPTVACPHTDFLPSGWRDKLVEDRLMIEMKEICPRGK
jgi:hypothetical protein